MRIVIWEEDDVLTVPTSSLFRHGAASERRPGESGWAVFAVEEGKASLREDEIGMRNGLAAEVKSGLDDGQQVIVRPSDSIEDRVKVEEREV